MPLVFASSNLHKCQEIQAALDPIGISVVSCSDFSISIPDSIESFGTYAENAKAKCSYVKSALNQPQTLILADDFGLEVDVLWGDPGVHSARYSVSGNDPANRTKLSDSLRSYSFHEKTARFRCVLCLFDSNAFHYFEGTVEGFILQKEEGSKGFGYDPLFYYPPLQRTFSNLSPAEKNRISHRGNAVKKLVRFFEYQRWDSNPHEV